MRAKAAGSRADRAIYLFPRHPGERDRLDVQHYALREAVGANYLAPVGRPARVLDVGCGTGRWAYDLCEAFPDAVVAGLDVDVGLVNPDPPPNFHLVRSNVLQGLPFADDRFDFVHQRLLAASAIPLRSWAALVGQLARVTRPGGWVELVEVDPRVEPAGPNCQRLWELGLELVRRLGLDGTGFAAETLDRYLRMAGLDCVELRTVKVPVGEWGGRIGSMMASHYRAMGVRLSGALEAHLGLPAVVHHELLRLAQLEWEEQQSRSTYVIAYGLKRR